MKKVLAGLLIFSSLSVFARTTDYTCALKKKNSPAVLVTANALFQQLGNEGNHQYVMMVSNHLGFSLQVIVKDKELGEVVISEDKYLKGEENSDENPLELTYYSKDRSLIVVCTRADHIQYPN